MFVQLFSFGSGSYCSVVCSTLGQLKSWLSSFLNALFCLARTVICKREEGNFQFLACMYFI